MTKQPNERGAIVISASDIEQRSELSSSLAFTWFTVLFLAYAGGVANAVTYSLVHPLEVVKIRMQATGRDLPTTLRAIRADAAGWSTLSLGVGATGLGYFLYGFVIFPLFELGKLYVTTVLGEATVAAYRLPVVLAVSIFCTLIGSVFLVPFESVKIKMVANPAAFSRPLPLNGPESLDHGFGAAPHRPRMLTLAEAFDRIRTTESWGSLWASYPLLCLRNITCNIGRFLVFDLYDDVLLLLAPDALVYVSGVARLPLPLLLLKGAVTGVSSAVLSTPADSVLTKVTRGPEGRGLSLPRAILAVYEEQGWRGYLRGLAPRVAWSVLVNAVQVCFYQSLKDLFFDFILVGTS
jgi:solute carrier family 25 phosphate transporter 3